MDTQGRLSGFTPLEVCLTLRRYYGIAQIRLAAFVCNKTAVSKRLLTGFTLVELVVVIGIMALISAVAIANFPSFRDSIAVNKESGKVAVALRNAQSFSLGVQQFASFTGPQGSCEETFQSNFPSYGASFAVADTAYYLFGDVNCNARRDAGAEEAETFLFESGVRTEKICVNIDDTGFDCEEPSAPNAVNAVDIVYKRPFPQVKISNNEGSYASVRLTLQSRDGATKRNVVIRSTGQVSVEH